MKRFKKIRKVKKRKPEPVSPKERAYHRFLIERMNRRWLDSDRYKQEQETMKRKVRKP